MRSYEDIVKEAGYQPLPATYEKLELFVCSILYDFEFATGRPYYKALPIYFSTILSTYRWVNQSDVVLEPHEEQKLRKIIRRYKRLGAFDSEQ